jgi:hypothetical protein
VYGKLCIRSKLIFFSHSLDKLLSFYLLHPSLFQSFNLLRLRTELFIALSLHPVAKSCRRNLPYCIFGFPESLCPDAVSSPDYTVSSGWATENNNWEKIQKDVAVV